MTYTEAFLAVAMAALVAGPAGAQDKGKEVDPLSLEAATPSAAVQDAADGRLFVEAALGDQQRRHGLDSGTTTRLSIDFVRRFKLGAGWRATFSDRLDAQDPPGAGARERVLNSLREAFVGWGSDSGERVVEFGRINLRNGPAYGYNPTDFFRAGALRSPTTADPISLRENRLGTVMLRGQYLLGDQAFALALAPKLENAPDGSSFSLDLGSTNASDRVLVTWSSRIGERLNTQVLLFDERGRGSQIGFNATALLGDTVVTYGEWTRGRSLALAAGSGPQRTGSRYALGATLTLPAKVALTVEASYNGFGVDKSTLRQLQTAGPAALGALLVMSQVQQEQWSRRAWTVYVTQPGWFTRQLDVTAVLRVDAVDRSRLGWVELRHHWVRLDGAVQFQWSRGEALSEYGMHPVRRSLKALIAAYF